jgi:hypothetical protein
LFKLLTSPAVIRISRNGAAATQLAILRYFWYYSRGVWQGCTHSQSDDRGSTPLGGTFSPFPTGFFHAHIWRKALPYMHLIIYVSSGALLVGVHVGELCGAFGG